MTKKAKPDKKNDRKHLFDQALPSYLPDVVIQKITQIESKPLGLDVARKNLAVWEALIFDTPHLWSKIKQRAEKDKQPDLGLNVLYAVKASHHDFKKEKEREIYINNAYQDFITHGDATLKAIDKLKNLVAAEDFYDVRAEGKTTQSTHIWEMLDQLYPLLKRLKVFNQHIPHLSLIYDNSAFQVATTSRQRNAPHNDFVRAFLSCVLSTDSGYPIKKTSAVLILEEIVPILYGRTIINAKDIRDIIKQLQKKGELSL